MNSINSFSFFEISSESDVFTTAKVVMGIQKERLSGLKNSQETPKQRISQRVPSITQNGKAGKAHENRQENVSPIGGDNINLPQTPNLRKMRFSSESTQNDILHNELHPKPMHGRTKVNHSRLAHSSSSFKHTPDPRPVHERLHTHSHVRATQTLQSLTATPTDMLVAAAKHLSLQTRNELKRAKQRGRIYQPARASPHKSAERVQPQIPQMTSPYARSFPSTRVRRASPQHEKVDSVVQNVQQIFRLSFGTPERPQSSRQSRGSASKHKQTARGSIYAKSKKESTQKELPRKNATPLKGEALLKNSDETPQKTQDEAETPRSSPWSLRVIIPKLKIPMQYISELTTGRKKESPEIGKFDYMEYFEHYSKKENEIHH